jgi:TP901-1 family phage major tail protein
MAKARGRDLLFKIKVAGVYTLVGGLRARSMKLNNTTVDVTTQDSIFGNVLMSEIEAGMQKLSITGTVLFDTDPVAKAAFDACRTQSAVDAEIVVPNYGTFQNAAMIVTGIEFTGDHEKEMSSPITLEASGQINFTPAG